MWNATRYGAALALGCLFGRAPRISIVAFNLRLFMEAMGATFIKVGQYLAIRRDLLPEPVCAELSHLFGDVAVMPPARVREVVETELGCPLEEAFETFDLQPVSGASVAQVHRGVTKNGELVAVKVQRVGIETILRADLRLMRRVADMCDALELFGAISMRRVVDEIAEFTLRELDFLSEARTAELLRADDIPGAVIPRTYPELTTHKVLTMEFVEGYTLLEICQAAESGDSDGFVALLGNVDAVDAVNRLARACFYQIFVTGRFHGDPHPANVIIRRDGAVVFVDFGIFAELDAAMRDQFRAYVRHVAYGQIDEAFRRLAWLVPAGSKTCFRDYRRAASEIMHVWYAASRNPRAGVAERLVAGYQGSMFNIMRHQNIQMPTNQLLFWRALSQVDSIAHRLPIEFDLLEAMREFFRSQNLDAEFDIESAVRMATEPAADAVADELEESFQRWISLSDEEHPAVAVIRDIDAEDDRVRCNFAKRVALVLVGISIVIPTVAMAPGASLSVLLLVVGSSIVALSMLRVGT